MVSDNTSGGWRHVPAILKQIVVPEFPDRGYFITDFGAIGGQR